MPVERNTIAPQIIDEASEWFVTMREPDASLEEREAFVAWLRTSPVHVSAYLEIARLWSDTSHIDSAVPVDMKGDPARNVVSIKEGAESSFQRGRSSLDARTAKPTRRVAIAASLIIALAGVGAWLFTTRAPSYATDVGEQRTVSLEDGSVVKLNSRSRLSVHMSPRVRHIELLDGQALFEVAHDTHRPFVVTTGNSSIRAVGTQFDVNRKSTGTIVTVIEGRVRLEEGPATRAAADKPSSSGITATEEIYLSAGEQMRIGTSGALERTTNPNTAAAISWLQQELIFEGQALPEVLEEFNRYSRTPMVLADPSLGEIRINAIFHTTNPDSLLRFISLYDDVRVERSEKEIRISRR